MAKASVRDLLRAQTGKGPRINLIDLSADQTKWVGEKKALKKLIKQHSKLFDLQSRLWAEQKRSILIAMQGMDTSGKDGTVKHVMTGMNPGGVVVHSFKAPTAEEKRHNFLWRFKSVLPPPGTIGIFNRTYYEDVLIARVKKLVGENTIENRYGEINRFEQQLVRSGTVVIKLFLHIDYDEQRRRLLARLENPDKHWKFSENDVNERAFWDDYTSAYDAALTRCNTAAAPWYVIPANNKWYRDWAVAQILIETLEEMNPQYPRPRLNVKALEKRLTTS
ncbi:MAG TPA: PPK2 family polyphosphate kinase [Candidatus Dormibacteraeota bacterium]